MERAAAESAATKTPSLYLKARRVSIYCLGYYGCAPWGLLRTLLIATQRKMDCGRVASRNFNPSKQKTFVVLKLSKQGKLLLNGGNISSGTRRNSSRYTATRPLLSSQGCLSRFKIMLLLLKLCRHFLMLGIKLRR
jgi:hypothetical protein